MSANKHGKRAGDPLITVTEACTILGIRRDRDGSLRRALGKPDLVGGVPSGAREARVELYRRSRVEDLARRREKRAGGIMPGAGSRTGDKRRLCAGCGRIFRSTTHDRCITCRTGDSRDDPAGVMIKPKKQTRRCPDCGGELWAGQYRCAACREKKAHLYENPGPWLEAGVTG